MEVKALESDFQDSRSSPCFTDNTAAYDSHHSDSSSPIYPFGRPEHFEEDHSWSVLSNSVFLFAGLSYLCIAVWDVFFYPTVQDDSANPLIGAQKIAYSVVVACGVIGYFVDSVIDVIWARRIRERVKAKKRMQRIGNNDAKATNVKQYKTRRFRPQKLKRKILEQLNRVRKHAAHRRDYYAACFFGAASTSALLDWIYDCVNRESRPPFNFLSVHFYLLSAIFALAGTRSRPISCAFSIYDPDYLEDMGDIFFLVGSLVDTMLCDFHFDDATVDWELLSAFLWALDASLYLRSDAVVWMELSKEKRIQQLYDEAIENSLHNTSSIETDDESVYYEMSDLDRK